MTQLIAPPLPKLIVAAFKTRALNSFRFSFIESPVVGLRLNGFCKRNFQRAAEDRRQAHEDFTSPYSAQRNYGGAHLLTFITGLG